MGFAVFALLAWARRKPVLAAVLIGLGASAKLWPAFLLIPILLLGWRARRLGDAIFACSIAVLMDRGQPAGALAWPNAWYRFFDLNVTREVDWGTLWYIGVPTSRTTAVTESRRSPGCRTTSTR